MELKGKTVIVTGGAVRIGRSICLEMAEAGATVFCHYFKSNNEAQSLKDEFLSRDKKLNLIQGDLSDTRFAESLVERIYHTSKQIDVLINNAAIIYKTPFGTINETQWDEFFNLNLRGAFFCAQKAGQFMEQNNGGKIINIGDTSGENPWPSFLPYSITKSGIIAMTKGLAKALAPKVQVNCINPGPMMIPEEYSDEEREKAINSTLLRREGTAEDIAKAVRFLIEGTDYITGTILNVDGGRSINF